jgi:epoxyqueuosine reductase QueG
MLSAKDLKEQINTLGADLVGVASADSPLLKEHGEDPEKLLPGAQSLITFGVALNRSAVCSGNMRLNRYDSMCVYERINHIGLETTRILTREGASAVSVPAYLPVDMAGESRGMKGDVNHKTVAAIAGMGSIGLSRLLLTPEFGPFLRLGTVVTDASLNADQPRDENPCEDCDACRTACPVDAIKEDGTLDYKACAGSMLRSGLPGVITAVRGLVGADQGGAKAVVYNPDFWDTWQATVSGIFYSCSECMAACPIGAD